MLKPAFVMMLIISLIIEIKLSRCQGIKSRHIYEAGYIIPNPQICPNFGKTITVSVFIMSAPKNIEKRQGIRRTWARSKLYHNVSIAFLIAVPAMTSSGAQDKKVEQNLNKEIIKYGDIIQAKFVDSYQNLSLKVISMLEWVDVYCPKTKSVLKTDDDVFINVKQLLHFAQANVAEPCKRVIYSWINKGTKPIRDPKSKYFTSHLRYPYEKFPDYANGPGYLITVCAVRDLYVTALGHNYLGLEDLFITGIVAKECGVRLQFARELITVDQSLKPCNLQKSICVINVIGRQQLVAWRHLLDNKTRC